MSTRAATIRLPLGQMAFVGMGVFCVANPEKFFSILQKGSQVLLADFHPNQGHHQSQQPIIIHHGGSGSSSQRTVTGTVVQLVCGAGLCWGSYMVLITVLPEAAKGMLPVTTKHFNKAVASLGNAVIHLKDTMVEQMMGLSKKQDDLSDKQEETYVEVLNVKDNVFDLKGDLSLVQESLDLCHATLSESERRTSYIAHGVQLLTRGVSTFLADNDDLMVELKQFNSVGEQYKTTPIKSQQQLRKVVQSMSQKEKDQEEHDHEHHYHHSNNGSTPYKTMQLLDNSNNRSPESEIPYRTYNTDVEQSLTDLRALLATVKCGN